MLDFAIESSHGYICLDKDTGGIMYLSFGDEYVFVKLHQIRAFHGANTMVGTYHKLIAYKNWGYRAKSTAVHHRNHLEYDNQRSNLDVFTVNAKHNYKTNNFEEYHILDDYKWCQDLYFLYMLDYMNADEFYYQRLLRLARVTYLIKEFKLDDELRKYGIEYDDCYDSVGDTLLRNLLNFFIRDTPKKSSLGYMFDMFDLADCMLKGRLKVHDLPEDVFTYSKLTSTDYLILNEYQQSIFELRGYYSDDELYFEAAKNYLRVCNYPIRLLTLIKDRFSDVSFKRLQSWYAEYAEAQRDLLRKEKLLTWFDVTTVILRNSNLYINSNTDISKEEENFINRMCDIDEVVDTCRLKKVIQELLSSELLKSPTSNITYKELLNAIQKKYTETYDRFYGLDTRGRIQLLMSMSSKEKIRL